VLHEVTGLPTGVRGVAFDEDGSWVVEVINDTDVDLTDVSLDLPGDVSDLHVYETDSLRDLAPMTPDRRGLLPRVELPARGLTTVIVGPIGNDADHGRAGRRLRRSPGG
jgi:hypothetical protein